MNIMENDVKTALKQLVINNFHDFSSYDEDDEIWDLPEFPEQGLNSADFIKLIVSIEKRFKIVFEEEYLYSGRLKCFNDLVKYIETKIE